MTLVCFVLFSPYEHDLWNGLFVYIEAGSTVSLTGACLYHVTTAVARWPDPFMAVSDISYWNTMYLTLPFDFLSLE